MLNTQSHSHSIYYYFNKNFYPMVTISSEKKVVTNIKNKIKISLPEVKRKEETEIQNRKIVRDSLMKRQYCKFLILNFRSLKSKLQGNMFLCNTDTLSFVRRSFFETIIVLQTLFLRTVIPQLKRNILFFQKRHHGIDYQHQQEKMQTYFNQVYIC